MNKVIRITSIICLLLTGINALVAGALFIIEPSGSKMGMSVAYLKPSPFHTYLIPGIILFTINGVLNVFAAYFAIKQKNHYQVWIAVQGILLMGWILIQVLLLKDLNILHVIMFTVGFILMVSGILLYKLLHK